jgi:3-phosphoshikimate 1-carboxyvinyltransferase
MDALNTIPSLERCQADCRKILEMPSLSVTPARRVNGTLRVPGDKSISHRYALLAALAEGRSCLLNYAPGADCQSTLSCVRALGVEIGHDAGGGITLMGRGLAGWCSPAGPLDAGNSGTTMRMLAGLLAAQPFTTTMIGDDSLSRRPMRRVIEPLSRMGATIESVGGYPPLTIRGTHLSAIAHAAATPSAQVKSAVLLAGLYADGVTSVTEPAQTRDHTERALAAFGIDVVVQGPTISVAGGQRATARTLTVPGDFSSAAFWMVAAAARPESRVEIEDVGLNPTRTGLVDVLRRYGAHVDIRETGQSDGEPRGTVVVEHRGSGAVDISPSEVPALIDELPAIAALAAHGGRVSVRGAAELRVKESDRIAALVAGFRGIGIDADERPDGFTIQGRGTPAGGVADARGDHRMAMAFAIAALAARSPSRIEGAEAVAISYPDFFETLHRLVA